MTIPTNTHAAPRDPRVDPKAGDVLSKPRSDREVTRVSGSIISYRTTLHWGGVHRTLDYDSVQPKTMFVVWAKNAEVIHRAE